jgi:hypothetical protein
MVVGGERPSLSEVARLAGVSRQALLKDRKPVTEFVATLRNSWQPRADGPEAKQAQLIDEARSQLKKERLRRKQAENERDRALHHPQLAEATLVATCKRGGEVTPIRRE